LANNCSSYNFKKSSWPHIIEVIQYTIIATKIYAKMDGWAQGIKKIIIVVGGWLGG